MFKLLSRLGILAGLTGAGIAISRAIGSTDEATSANPLPPCPDDMLNCFRASRPFGASTEVIGRAIDRAVRGHAHVLTGRPVEIRRDGLRLDAVFQIGPLKDDVTLVAEGDSLGSVVHLRSASRVGRSDMGLNRLRAKVLFDAIAAEAKKIPADAPSTL